MMVAKRMVLKPVVSKPDFGPLFVSISIFFRREVSSAPLHHAHAFHLHLPITRPPPHSAHSVRHPFTHLSPPSLYRAARGGSTWPDGKRSRVLLKT
jgi:hypothetical protein